jgi:hypothetical protein
MLEVLGKAHLQKSAGAVVVQGQQEQQAHQVVMVV